MAALKSPFTMNCVVLPDVSGPGEEFSFYFIKYSKIIKTITPTKQNKSIHKRKLKSLNFFFPLYRSTKKAIRGLTNNAITKKKPSFLFLILKFIFPTLY